MPNDAPWLTTSSLLARVHLHRAGKFSIDRHECLFEKAEIRNFGIPTTSLSTLRCVIITVSRRAMNVTGSQEARPEEAGGTKWPDLVEYSLPSSSAPYLCPVKYLHNWSIQLQLLSNFFMYLKRPGIEPFSTMSCSFYPVYAFFGCDNNA